MEASKNKKPRVVVIGLDGFTWKTLDYLKQDLRMVNLEKLKENSAWGRLVSTDPPNTIPAWISMATGCNPGKHNVFNFTEPLENFSDNKIICSKDVKAETIQQILNKNGLKSVLINLHGSTPALTEDITLGTFLSASKDLFYPKEMANNPEFSDYPAYVGNIYLQDKKLFIDNLSKQLDTRFRIAKKLFETGPDFYFLLFSESDHLQHMVFDQIKKGKLNKEIKSDILSLYKKLDDCLGWFMDNIGEDTYLILISDHGFESYDYVFNLNDFLESKGLLSYTQIQSEWGKRQMREVNDRRLSINVKPVISLMDRTQLTRKLLDQMRVFYLKVGEITKISSILRISGFIRKVDMSKSKTIGNESGVIYINKNLMNNIETSQLRDQLIKILKEEKSPYTKKCPFSLIETSDNLYHGPYVADAPDIIIESKDHGFVGQGYFGSIYSKSVKNFHDKYGIFAVRGPGIRKGRTSDRQIIDIAPLILHAFGLGIPSYMDGEVMTDIFDDTAMKEVKKTKGMAELNVKLKKLKKKLL